jgi:hypothetical protein
VKTDESPIGIYFWLILIAIINVTWIGMDVWLYRNGHEMLTTEFKEGLQSKWFGPLLCFLVAGTIAAFCWHMWNTRDAG